MEIECQYVVARMLWNPALSADEMIDDYCEKGFNSAAKEMKAYFNLQEALTRRNADMAAGRAKLQATADADGRASAGKLSIRRATNRRAKRG